MSHAATIRGTRGVIVAGLRLLAAALPGGEVRSTGVTVNAEALRARHPGTWRMLYEDAREPLYRYAFSRLGNEGDAEDAVGQVFEEAWEHADRYEDHGLPARAWLFGIARNVIRMRRRSLFRQPPMIALEAFDQPHDERAIDPALLDLARAVDRLPRDLAETVTLRFLHDLTVEETAAVLRVPASTVKGRQLRALNRMREWLMADGERIGRRREDEAAPARR